MLHSHIRLLPVTDECLANQSLKYLNWFYCILSDFQALLEAAQAGQCLPKLFSWLPQKSNETAFITISTTSLHR